MMDIDHNILPSKNARAKLKTAGITTVEQLLKADEDKICDLKLSSFQLFSLAINCLRVYSGEMLDSIKAIDDMKIERNKRERPENWIELQEKARRYDRIVSITKKTINAKP